MSILAPGCSFFSRMSVRLPKKPACTAHIIPQAPLAISEAAGVPNNGDMHVIERIHLAGKDILEQIKWFEAILFITSPNRVTEYHIDRECSWLFQIKGDKDIHFFDRADKDVLPDAELEKYYDDNGDNPMIEGMLDASPAMRRSFAAALP